jgi:3-oxoacyl-[acyl-carrier protein] reductase
MEADMSTKAPGVALITGASGGIGGAVARRLASDGFKVVVHYAGSSSHADKVVSEIAAKGGRAISVQADVADLAQVQALFAETQVTLGGISAVVHCAGIMPLSSIESGDVELFDQVIRTNLRGTFIILSEAAKTLVSGGRIVAFSSSVIAKSFPTYGHYIASKAGVEGLVHVLANELRGRNITVNGLAPGPIATPLFLNGKTEEQVEQFAKLSPLERVGQPEDIANVVSFLVGPDGGWINGQILRANGGFA